MRLGRRAGGNSGAADRIASRSVPVCSPAPRCPTHCGDRRGREGVPGFVPPSIPGGSALAVAVDDDPQSLRYIRHTMVKAGYRPVVTGDPGEALRLVEEEKPRLAVLDLVLPGGDGIELMQSIMDVSDVPVIFTSAYGRDDTIARAFEAGAVDYVVKPTP